MACDLSYPNQEFAALMISLPNMLIHAKIAGSLCVFLTGFEYQYSPNGDFTVSTLFV